MLLYFVPITMLVMNMFKFLWLQKAYKDYYMTWFYISALTMVFFRETFYIQLGIYDCMHSWTRTQMFRVTDLLASYSNFIMGMSLAYTQFNAVFNLMMVVDVMKHKTEEEVAKRHNYRQKCLFSLGAVIVTVAGLLWLAIIILQFPFDTWTDTYSQYIYSCFFFILAVLMATGTIMLNILMSNKFGKQSQERGKFVCIFMSISVIIFLQSVWYSCYFYLLDQKLSDYHRYLTENTSNLLWDVPIVIIVCYYHKSSFQDKTKESEK